MVCRDRCRTPVADDQAGRQQTVLAHACAHDFNFCILERLIEVENMLEQQPGWSSDNALRLEQLRERCRDVLADIETEIAETEAHSLEEAAAKARVLLRITDTSAADLESRIKRSLCADLLRLATAHPPDPS